MYNDDYDLKGVQLRFLYFRQIRTLTTGPRFVFLIPHKMMLLIMIMSNVFWRKLIFRVNHSVCRVIFLQPYNFKFYNINILYIENIESRCDLVWIVILLHLPRESVWVSIIFDTKFLVIARITPPGFVIVFDWIPVVAKEIWILWKYS